VKAMFIVGENPAACFPQPSKVKEALKSLEFLVVSDMFMTDTASLATVVLPAASFAEKEGTFTNFEGRVQPLRKAIEPVGDSLSDSEIIMKLSEIMGSPMPYISYQNVLEEIEEMVPFYRHFSYSGFGSSGMDWEDMDRENPTTRRLYKGLFPSGFGKFHTVKFTPSSDVASEEYPYTLLTGSSRYHFGSGMRTSHAPRLKRYCPELSLEINRDDARHLGINDSDHIDAISENGKLTVGIVINSDLPKGMLYLPITYPAGPVFELFSSAIDGQTKAPAFKSCAVRLERTAEND
jgi:formate dehydrogenase major subunit